MHVVVVNLPDLDWRRWERCERRFRHHDLERFEGVWNLTVGLSRPEAIAETYRDLLVAHAAAGWGHETVVFQDDVELLEIPAPTAPLTVYSVARPDGHVCPHAFSADAEARAALAEVWTGAESGNVCNAWQPVIDDMGVVLNLAVHLEPSRLPKTRRPTGPGGAQ